MKKLLFLFLIIIASHNLWSQQTYELDSIVSVSIPGETIKIDTLKNNKITLQFRSVIENSKFVAQKEMFENDSINIYESNLPSDLKNLETTYKTLAAAYSKNTSFKLESEKMIEKDSLKGYHLILQDSLNANIYEVEYFLINKYVYVFEHKTSAPLNTFEKDAFFNSIKIKYDKKLDQFIGKTQGEKTAYTYGYTFGKTLKNNPSYIWIAAGIFLMLIVGIIIFFVKKN